MNLDELEALERAAMPAPWRHGREPDTINPWFDAHPGEPIESRGTAFALGVAVGVTADARDADLIAALRNAAPALIAELREARATIARLTEERDAAREAHAELRRRQNAVESALWELRDAGEEYLSADPVMPSYQSSADRLDAAIIAVDALRPEGA